MITRVKRDGMLYEIRFERGDDVRKLKKIGPAQGTGTTQWFMPDPEVFETHDVFDSTSCRGACASWRFSITA